MDSSLIGVIIGGSLSIIGLIIQKHYDAKNLEKNRHEEKKLRQFELKRKAYENFFMTFSQYRDSLILDFSPVVSATCLLTLYGNATIREKAARYCLLRHSSCCDARQNFLHGNCRVLASMPTLAEQDLPQLS